MPPIEAQTEVFRLSAWVILPTFFCGGIAFLFGLWLLRSKATRRPGWVILFMGTLGAGIFGPSLLNERLVVSPTSYELRDGFWFAPTKRRFEYKDVEFITEDYRVSGRLGRRKLSSWSVQLKNGSVLEVSQSDVCIRHRERVLLLLTQYGVRFQ